MAKLVHDASYPNAIRVAFAWWKLLLIGIGLGSIFVLLAYLIHTYVLDPMYCGKFLDGTACQASVENAGNIANIIVFVIGTLMVALIRVRYAVIVSLASAITLWGLSGWTKGLPAYEVWGFAVLLYVASYLAYAWITQTRKFLMTGVLVAIIVVGIRVIISL
jgi:hypothetical protein